MDHELLDRIKHLATTSPEPFAELSMDEIATRLGVTRMTLYRRAGSRQQIVDALAAEGIDARAEPDVRERVLEATAALLRHRPVGEVTLELIAGDAGCSLAAIYARFGSRVGVFKAVIERYSPLVPVREAVAAEVAEETPDLRHDVRVLYATVLPRILREWPILQGLLAEALRDPASEVGQAFREWYLPQVTSVLVPLFTRHIAAGTIRPLPIPIVVQLLTGPMAAHGASRRVIVEELGLELPDLDGTIDLFTDLFCRAVAAESPPAG